MTNKFGIYLNEELKKLQEAQELQLAKIAAEKAKLAKEAAEQAEAAYKEAQTQELQRQQTELEEIFEDVRNRITAYWFVPEGCRRDIVIEIELIIDDAGNIVGNKLLNKKNDDDYFKVASSVIRAVNDPRVSPLPTRGRKLPKIVWKFCPKDLTDFVD